MTIRACGRLDERQSRQHRRQGIMTRRGISFVVVRPIAEFLILHMTVCLYKQENLIGLGLCCHALVASNHLWHTFSTL